MFIKLILHSFFLRTEVEKTGPSGGARSDWPLFDKVQKVLNPRPIKNLQEKVDQSFTFESEYN